MMMGQTKCAQLVITIAILVVVAVQHVNHVIVDIIEQNLGIHVLATLVTLTMVMLCVLHASINV